MHASNSYAFPPYAYVHGTQLNISISTTAPPEENNAHFPFFIVVTRQ